MYVRPQSARSGIGSALLRYTENVIYSGGFSAVRLNASWNAEAFYLHHGYKPQETWKKDEGCIILKLLRIDW